MTDITNVNPQILQAIEAAQQASMTGTVITHAGAGKAYQSVAQSTAIAIQDATDTLRNFSTIGTTAAGVAVAQMVATGDTATFTAVMAQIDMMLKDSTHNYKEVGKNASDILSSFPSGG